MLTAQRKPQLPQRRLPRRQPRPDPQCAVILKYWRIFLITAGSSMLAITLPPARVRRSQSQPNTRFSRCAQLIASRRSADVRSSVTIGHVPTVEGQMATLGVPGEPAPPLQVPANAGSDRLQQLVEPGLGLGGDLS